MRAAEDDRVDRDLEIRLQPVEQIVLDLRPTQHAAFDKLHETPAREGDDLRLRVVLALECLKFLLLDGHRCRHHENPAAGVLLHRRLERRLRADHGDLGILLTQHADGCGRRRVAGNDQRLHPVLDQSSDRRVDERADLLLGFDAVGRVQRIAVIQIILLRQQPHRLAQDADPAKPGVKKCDRPILLLHPASLLSCQVSRNRTILSRSYSPLSISMRSVRSGGSVCAHLS